MFSSAMSDSSYGNVVPRNRYFSKLSGINFSLPESYFVSNFSKPSFVLVCLIDEVPEDVMKLLHVFPTITFADVADQRRIRRASV